MTTSTNKTQRDSTSNPGRQQSSATEPLPAGAADTGNSYWPIADYAIVGNCHTVALIAKDGSIDWYCPLRFDRPAVICRLLDVTKGGYLRLAPAAQFCVHRSYRGSSNILETIFDDGTSKVRLTDFMTIDRQTVTAEEHDVTMVHRLVRLVEVLSGEVEMGLIDQERTGSALSGGRWIGGS